MADSNDFYSNQTPFFTSPLEKVPANEWDLPKASALKEPKYVLSSEITIDSFDVGKKKKPAENEKYLLYIYPAQQIKLTRTEYIFFKKIPVIMPSGYQEISSNERSAEHSAARKKIIFQKYLYLNGLDENNFLQYNYLVLKIQNTSSVAEIFSILAENQLIYITGNVKKELIIIYNFLIKLEKKRPKFRSVLTLEFEDYVELTILFFCKWFTTTNKEEYEFLQIGFNIWWLLHLVIPHLNDLYKKNYSQRLFKTQEFYPEPFMFSDGESFARNIETIFIHILFMAKPMIDYYELNRNFGENRDKDELKSIFIIQRLVEMRDYNSSNKN
jgi:hypothetical protein